jgi:hypothetical protein
MKISWKTSGHRSGLFVNDTEIAYISHPGRYEGVDDYVCCMPVSGGYAERRLVSNNLEDAKKELINILIQKYEEQIGVWKECIADYEERVSILKVAIA